MLSAPVLEPPIARALRSDYVTTGGYINFNDPALAVSRYEWEYSGQRLVYQFNQNTSVTRDDVILTRLNNGAQLPAGDLIDSTSGYSETQVFDFPINPTFGYRTLPNGNYEAILRANGPSNNDGQKLASENVTGFFVLMGDINHDRVVNGDDYGIIDFNSMFEESRSYVAGDLNYSNEEVGYAINADDYALIDSAGTYGTSMPKAPSAANTLIAYASLGRGRIDLNWTAPTDMSNVNGFRIFRSTDGGANYVAYATVAATQRNWFETGLPDGKKYNYRVRPYSTANGNGPTTNAAWAVTNLPGPGELSATAASGNGVNLNFTDNTNDESGFEVWQSTSGGAFVLVDTLPANAEQGPMVYRVNGLTPATSYSFRVRAKSAAQSSIFTLRETVTTAGSVIAIAITNPGFEQTTPALTDGQETTSASTIPGWTLENGPVGYESGEFSTVVVRNPSAGQFPDQVAQGSNTLVLSPTVSDYIAMGPAAATQTLAAVLDPNTRYTLSAKVNNPGGGSEPDDHVSVYLLAGGVPIIQLTAAGTNGYAILSQNADSTSFAQYVNEQLSIMIIGPSFGSDDQTESAIDDIQLSATVNAAVQSPRGGTPWAVPGVIEFEDFDDGGQNVSWLDTTDGNTGGEYRRDTDADVDVARDDTGSFIVGWAKPTEWLEYTIDVINAGNYDLTSYVSSPGTGVDNGTFHWELIDDNNNATALGGTLAVPKTGGYFTYEPVTLSNISLSQGQHVLRLKLDTAGSNTAGWNSVANFNYFTLNQTNGNLSNPMGLIATAPYSNRVDLSWTNDDTNAVSFNVQRSGDNGATWTTIKTGLRAGTTFYADTTAGGTSLYRVFAVGAGGDTMGSEIVSVSAPPPTDRPTDGQPWLINFQVDGTIPFPAYLIDSGNVFGDRGNGLTYGWNIDHTIQDRERGINSDRRLDTLVHFRQGGEWSIAIPDGPYDVTVSIGDPGWASTYTLNVNGVSYWNNLALAKNVFPPPKKMMINVTDGKIVLDAGASPDRSTKINYIEITSPDVPPPEGTPVVKIEAKNAQGVIDNTAFEDTQDPAWFTITRSGDTSNSLDVAYVIAGDSTASSNDYTPLLSGTATIPVGESSYSFSVTPVQDSLAEGLQTLTLALAENLAYVRGTSSSATVRIYDANDPGNVIVGVFTEDLPLTEMALYSGGVGDFHIVPAQIATGQLTAAYVQTPIDTDNPYLRGRDFEISIDPGGNARLDMFRDGMYVVEATYSDGSGAATTEFTAVGCDVEVGTQTQTQATGSTTWLKTLTKRERPRADLVLISTGPEYDSNFLKAARLYYPEAKAFSSILDAEVLINGAWVDNNLRPITVIIIDHGDPAYAGLGNGRKKPAQVGKYIAYLDPLSAADVLDFTLSIKFKVSAVRLLECSVARVGTDPERPADEQDGPKFVQNLADLSGALFIAYDTDIAISGNFGFYTLQTSEPRFFLPRP